MMSQNTPRLKRRRAPSPTAFFLGTLCLLLIAGIAGGSIWAHRELKLKDAAIQTLEQRLKQETDVFEEERAVLFSQIALGERERDAAQVRVNELLQERDSIQRTMQETMVPREILSPADFPVERAMARSGESLADFARRERTTVEILKALNDWASEDRPLSAYQTFWVPRKNGATPNGNGPIPLMP